MKRIRNRKIFIMLFLCILLSGCGTDGGVNIDFLKGGREKVKETEGVDTGFRFMEPG